MTNREIAEMFERVAAMLSIRGDQFHRILAYQRAAENIRELTRDLHQIDEEGKLTSIPSIGATLEMKIQEMLTTGHLEFYEKLAEEIPPSLVEMLRVEGLGPKRVGQIYRELHITTMDELAQAAAEGKLRQLPGMGEKSETKIIAGIEALARHGDDRTPLGDAWPIAQQAGWIVTSVVLIAGGIAYLVLFAELMGGRYLASVARADVQRRLQAVVDPVQPGVVFVERLPLEE